MSERDTLLCFGPFVLDPTRRKLRRGAEEIHLGDKAFDVLELLARNGGQLVTRETLIRTVWADTIVDEGNLTFQISTLRKALGDGGRYVVTVSGRGYQLAEDVQVAEATEVVVEDRTTVTASLRRPFLALGIVVVIAGLSLAAFFRRPVQTAPPSRIESVAVFPFEPIVAAQGDEALEIGMADTLITRIGGLGETIVRPLSAVRRYSGKDPLQAGHDLGVDAVLIGSVMIADGQIRVNTRLLRVSDGRQVWQDEIEVPLADLFLVQDTISAGVAEALALELTPDQQRKVRRRGTENFEAYRAYELGRLHLLRSQSDEYELGLKELQRAVELDPEYADAWALLGNAYARMPLGVGRSPQSTIEMARSATDRALELDPGLSVAWVTRGLIDFWYRWDFEGAETNLRRAIELDPNNGSAHLLYAHLLSNTNRHSESRREASTALHLEPVTPIVNALAAQFLMDAGDYDGAIRQYQRTLSIEPGFWVAELGMGKTLEMQGRYAEALDAFEKASSHSGENLEPLAYIAHVQAMRGDRAAARSRITELVGMSRDRYVSPYSIAVAYSGIGDSDSAFEWLRKACTDRDVSMTFLRVNRRWDSLRNDPRFREIERCVSLPGADARL